MAHRPRRARRGFTLIEAAMATVIIGVGVVAMVDAQQVFIRSNNWSSKASTAAFLANEIREMTRFMPKHDPVTRIEVNTSGGSALLFGWGIESNEFTVDDLDDLDDFDGVSFSNFGTITGVSGLYLGPINGFGRVIPEIDLQGDVVQISGNDQPMQGWVQTITVDPINPFDTSDWLVVNRPDQDQESLVDDPRNIGVETYPLRVTVRVTYQGPYDPQPETVTTLQWIVP